MQARSFCQLHPARQGALGKTIPCNLCGYEIPSEDFLFHQRIEEVLLERLKSHPPGGLKGDQMWPQCLAEVARIVAASVAGNPASVEETT